MKKYLIPIIILLVVLILSGCGGDGLDPLDNPDIGWVSERIEDIDEIGLIDIDPNEDNQELRIGDYGARTGRLYFTYNDLNGDESPLEAGTDGGGAIEVYSSVEDANLRADYLNNFLNGSAGGSYVIGTLVIRTSYKLSGEEQEVLVQLIINSLEKEN